MLFFRSVAAANGNRPSAASVIETAAGNPATEQHSATHRTHALGAGFPHHAWPATRIAEGINQRFDDFRSVFRLLLRQECILDCRTERESLDALRCPVGGDFLATHTPDFLGISLEEDIEQPLPELVDHPVLKRFWIFRGEQAGFAE